MDVMEDNGELVFLYQLVDGVTSNSFAMHTAMRAGIPQQILDRTNEACLLSYSYSQLELGLQIH